MGKRALHKGGKHTTASSSISGGAGGSAANQKASEAAETIQKLEEEKEKLEKKVKGLETQLELTQYQMADLKSRKAQEVSDMQQQLEDANKRRKEMMERLDRISLIEKAIVNLYLEVKERGGGGTRDSQEVDEERKLLHKQNPLVVLDRLRANLRTLLAFQEDYENELKSHIEKKRNETENELVKTKDELFVVMKENNKLRNIVEEAEGLKANAEAARQEVIEESRGVISELREDNKSLIEMVRAKDKKIDELTRLLDKKDEILRHKEMKMMRITQLESEIFKHKARHQFDVNKMRASNLKVRQEYEKEMVAAEKNTVEKRRLEDQVEQLSMQLNAYKSDACRATSEELAIRVKRLESLLTAQQAECKRVDEEKRAAIAAKEDALKKMQQIRQDLIRVQAAEAESRPASSALRRSEDEADAREAILLRSSVQDNSAAKFYRKKLEEREREVTDLTRRVKRLLVADRTNKALEEKWGRQRNTATKKMGDTGLLRSAAFTVDQFDMSTIGDAATKMSPAKGKKNDSDSWSTTPLPPSRSRER